MSDRKTKPKAKPKTQPKTKRKPAATKAKQRVAILTCEGVSRHYMQGTQRLDVLRDIDLVIGEGETLALVGPSGAGKSSLLHILGLLEAPSSGRVMVGEDDGYAGSDEKRTRLRCAHIGFVYQFHNLLPEFTALENACLPSRLLGTPRKQAQEQAAELLERLGLGERLAHQPSELSGGEQQRVAIARALINRPRLILADEPTGSLDNRTGAEVMELLFELTHDLGAALLMATHNTHLAKQMKRTISISDGKLA